MELTQGNTISDKEVRHLADLIMISDSARDAVNEALKAYKEKYNIDAQVLRQFVKSKFGDQEKHNANLEKHQQFVELDEQFENI